MLNHSSFRKAALGGLVIALASFAGKASADCDANGGIAAGGDGKCWSIRGSDTLFDIMTTAIDQARTDGGGTTTLALSAKDLFYQGTGSGNAENAMKAATATALGSQSIGPMSRNFRPSIIDPMSSTYTARDATNTASAGHAGTKNTEPTAGTGWYPNFANVVGLDAAVFVVKGTAALSNITFLPFTDNTIPASAFDKAVTNNNSLTLAFGNGNAFNKLNPTVNYSNIMSVILSGVDGSGTLIACSDPRRVQAIQDLTSFLGAPTINHFYRRDENSGTTDTFKDRIMVVPNTTDNARYPWTGGRFCNGAAIGGITGTTFQQGICSNNRAVQCTTDANCGTGAKCWFNLNNPDYDPIRRPCVDLGPGFAPTSCTDLTTGLPCQPSDNNPNCTQGLIVTLSDQDLVGPTVTDITTSIGNRVGTGDGSIMGYAGREAASSTFGTKSVAINTQAASDDKVRSSVYMLARRLFIQNSVVNSTNTWDIPTDSAGGGGGNGGSDQINKEQALWGFLSDRNKMDPIVRQFNFIRCAKAGDGQDPCAETGNLCCSDPAAAVPSAFGAYAPTNALSGANGGTRALKYDGSVVPVVTTGAISTGTAAAPGGWSEGRVCTSASPCTCSTATPCLAGAAVAFAPPAAANCATSPRYTVNGSNVATLPTHTTCPAGIGTGATNINYGGTNGLKVTGSPCTFGTECQSGLCGDTFNVAVVGELHDLYCQ
jgi:hypothetical protein